MELTGDVALSSLAAAAALPLYASFRAHKRIRHLEMTLLSQTSDTDNSKSCGAAAALAASPCASTGGSILL
jgi:hypothetical protein